MFIVYNSDCSQEMFCDFGSLFEFEIGLLHSIVSVSSSILAYLSLPNPLEPWPSQGASYSRQHSVVSSDNCILERKVIYQISSPKAKLYKYKDHRKAHHSRSLCYRTSVASPGSYEPHHDFLQTLSGTQSLYHTLQPDKDPQSNCPTPEKVPKFPLPLRPGFLHLRLAVSCRKYGEQDLGSVGSPLTSTRARIREGGHMNELGERCQVDEYDGGGMGLPQNKSNRGYCYRSWASIDWWLNMYIVFIKDRSTIHPIREVVRGIAGHPSEQCEYVGLRKSEGGGIIAIRYVPL